MIEIKKLTKEFVQGKHRFSALKEVTLAIGNEMTAIIGTSGAGKSTLLNIIAGVEPFEKGTLTIDGVSIADLSEKELAAFRNKNIGIVMQHYSLVSDFSVQENVYLPLSFSDKKYTKKEKLQKAKDALERVGIAYLTEREVKDLSGGEMQRVAIARAIVNYPRYILADEPTGALDGENTEKVMELLKKINQSGVGVIIVTHDMDVANQCQRIIKLEDGVVVADSVVS